MTELIIRTFNFLRSRRWLRLLTLLLSTLLLIAMVLRLNYKEDISDFLPLDNEHHNALRVYQDVAGANKLFAIFQYKDTAKADPDVIVGAIDKFTASVAEADTASLVSDVVSRVDMERLTEVSDFVYSNIPYFLSDADYRRMDSLLEQSDYVRRQMEQDKQMLMFPTGGLLSDNIGRDPLNLFTPVVAKLQGAGSGMSYEMYDGCIFSPDMQKAIVIISSPFGASESDNNTHILALLHSCADSTVASADNVEIHITGGPAIAVGNSKQIKADSILSVGLAAVLILALLLFTFRNIRNLLLIAVSIAWGWLFAMAGLALVHDSVSIIVIGISSVIVGIAVNYPLHFIAHLGHTPDKVKALREIVMPLVVGNITTVGAFLALVPLQSVALRDLGLFASFLLIGTIVFVLLYLPHLSVVRQQTHHTLLDRIGDISLENKPWVVVTVVVATCFFGWFSFRTTFDANMSHINYMTDEQKEDMAYFSENMLKTGASKTVYALSTDSTIDGALDKSLHLQGKLRQMTDGGLITKHSGCSQFLCSRKEQQRRLDLWKSFVARHKDILTARLSSEAAAEGFAEGSFNEFSSIISSNYEPHDIAYFDALRRSVFSTSVSADSINGTYSVVDVVTLNGDTMDEVKEQIDDSGAYSFDVASLNSAIANHLSDDFNYIGWACGCIVFFFLWLSLGSLELALLSFVPMAVSWVWILGIMGLFGIQFNIVNVILATFIFGQGDDYTIFMTEGASYEYAYRRKMLASYKHSIIVSALIMFIGIGSLIVAKHPALHSLAEVTIAGMFSVVLMAYILPPFLFKWLVSTRKGYRTRPLRIKPLMVMALSGSVFFLQLLSVYVLGAVLSVFCSEERRRRFLHQYSHRLFLFDLKHVPTVKLTIEKPGEEAFSKPSLVISNHQSMLDSSLFLALSPRCVLVSNQHVHQNRVIRKVFDWLGCIVLSGNMEQDARMISERMAEGYSVVFFPEGERNAQSSILRFHKGAFYMADRLQTGITPVFIHGANMVLPRNSFSVYEGQLTISVRETIPHEELCRMGDVSSRTKEMRRYYVEEYGKIAQMIETVGYFRSFILDRYIYKGHDIVHSVAKNLRHCATAGHEAGADGAIRVDDMGYGELALAAALINRQSRVVAVMADEERAEVLRYSAQGVADNIEIVVSSGNNADASTIKQCSES